MSVFNVAWKIIKQEGCPQCQELMIENKRLKQKISFLSGGLGLTEYKEGVNADSI